MVKYIKGLPQRFVCKHLLVNCVNEYRIFFICEYYMLTEIKQVEYFADITK